MTNFVKLSVAMFNTHNSISVRIERLVNGRGSPDDMTRLFLYLRDYAPKNSAVSEIGNFLAHPERKQGLVTDRLSDLFKVARYKFSTLGQKIDLSNVPSTFFEILEITCRLLDEAVLRQQLGMSRNAVRKSVVRIKPQFRPTSYRQYGFTGLLTAVELRVIQCLSSSIMSQPAFTGIQLHREVVDLLSQRNLASKDTLNNSRNLMRILGVYAISSMHGATATTSDSETYVLAVSPEPPSIDKLVVCGNSNVSIGSGLIRVSLAVFELGVALVDSCEASLLGPTFTADPSETTVYCIPQWNSGLEMSANGKLKALADT